MGTAYSRSGPSPRLLLTRRTSLSFTERPSSEWGCTDDPDVKCEEDTDGGVKLDSMASEEYVPFDAMVDIVDTVLLRDLP